MSNWYEAWADRYAEWSAGVTADVPFYVALARQADGLLVELAVGNGRVAIPVAQATGRRVVGIDSSPAMLAQARERAVEAGVELDLREEDIREGVAAGARTRGRLGNDRLQPRQAGSRQPAASAHREAAVRVMGSTQQARRAARVALRAAGPLCGRD